MKIFQESNQPGEQGREEKGNDDSYKGGTTDKGDTADNSGIAEKSKAEGLVDNVRQNMLEGDIQSEVVMNETQFEDYLVNQQVILFDNQRQSKGLREVKALDNGQSANNEPEELEMLSKILRSSLVLIGLFSVQSALAKSGGVDYSWGALMHWL